MKISVIMIDGGFRESAHAARTFAEQTFPESEFEVIWVEFFSKVHPEVLSNSHVKVVALGHHTDSPYHSSLCFNAGIQAASGDILVIPDADVLAPPDFLSRVYERHTEYDKLALYAYRADEFPAEHKLVSHDWDELERACRVANPHNYGACLSVRRKWLVAINGYEEHRVFSGGFHANGYDIFTRLRAFGLAIQWDRSIVLYHPWHPFTIEEPPDYAPQHAVIAWRRQNRAYLAFKGLNHELDEPVIDVDEIIAQANNETPHPEPLACRVSRTLRKPLGALKRKLSFQETAI